MTSVCIVLVAEKLVNNGNDEDAADDDAGSDHDCFLLTCRSVTVSHR